MNTLENLLTFLTRLEEAKIWYRLEKMRDAIMVEVAVPGQRWEIEFFADGSIEREVFESVDDVEGIENIDALADLMAPWEELRSNLDNNA